MAFNFFGLTKATKAIGDAIDNIHTSDEERLEIKLKLNELTHQINLGAQELQKVDAASDDKWQRRWRPALAYVAIAGLAFEMVIFPLARLIGLPIPPGTIDHQLIIYSLAYAGGYGIMRSGEKMFLGRG